MPLIATTTVSLTSFHEKHLPADTIREPYGQATSTARPKLKTQTPTSIIKSFLVFFRPLTDDDKTDIATANSEALTSELNTAARIPKIGIAIQFIDTFTTHEMTVTAEIEADFL